MSASSDTKTPAQRRRFLQTAASAAVGTAAMAAPAISRAQAVTSLRFQSTWPSKDIFHEYASDFAKKVNDMTGGELKIEVLPAGSVVPAFGLLDAVSKGPWTAATACWATTTASRMRWRCGIPARPSAWTPTCCCRGTSTAAARNC